MTHIFFLLFQHSRTCTPESQSQIKFSLKRIPQSHVSSELLMDKNPNHQCAVPPSLKRAIADFTTIMNGTTRRCMYVCMYNPKVVIPHAMVQCVITLGTTCHQDSIDRDILATNTRPFFFLDMSRQTYACHGKSKTDDAFLILFLFFPSFLPFLLFFFVHDLIKKETIRTQIDIHIDTYTLSS
jgi:hypothetical protein